MSSMLQTAMCFGTFDGLHPGHESLFAQAKGLAERLIVVVGLDETVAHVKGRLPKYHQSERLAAVEACELVDLALLGEADDMYAVIERIAPDVIVLGYDQEAFTAQLETELKQRSLATKIVRAHAFKPDIYKSSLLNPV